MALRWYVVHAYSNFEHRVAEGLKDRIKMQGLQDKFGEILVPTEEVVEMRDGESFAMAGLIRKDFQDTVKQVPLLGSIPIIGTLFRSSGFQNEQTELVIIVTPRLVGRMPFQRLRPALPIDTFSWSVLPTCPMVAMQSTSTRRVSPEGSFSSAYSPSLATSCADDPARRHLG